MTVIVIDYSIYKYILTSLYTLPIFVTCSHKDINGSLNCAEHVVPKKKKWKKNDIMVCIQMF